MSGTFVYARTWVGFNDSFPFFDAVEAASDDQAVVTLDRLAMEWLRSHREEAKERLRKSKAELVAALCKRQALVTFPSAGWTNRTGDRGLIRWPCYRGRQHRCAATRFARVAEWAGWGSFLAENEGRLSPSRRVWLGYVASREVAQSLIDAVQAKLRDYDYEADLGRLWTELQPRFQIIDATALPAHVLGLARAEIQELIEGRATGPARAFEPLMPVLQALLSGIAVPAGPPPKPPKVDNDTQILNELTDRQRDILRAMYEQKAFDRDSLQRTEDIAMKVEGRGVNVDGFKEPMSGLSSRGLIESKTGRGGGVWLTIDGVRLAARLCGGSGTSRQSAAP